MPKEFPFQEEDLKYIQEQWGKKSISAISEKIGCSRKALSNKAKKMGLSFPDNVWTEEQEKILRESLGKMSVEEISEKIGKSSQAIYSHISRFNLHTTPNWTKEQEEILELYWGCEPIETIATRVGKTTTALISKAKRMKLGNPFDANGEYLKVSQLEKVLNVSGDKIRKNWFQNGLKYKKVKLSKNKQIYGIKIEDLFKFLEKNQDSFDARYLEPNILGPEPKWLIEKRRRDYQNPPAEYRFWTESEIQTLRFLISKGKTQREIGEKINRSEYAVKSKIQELNLAEVRFWQEDEIQLLSDNFEQGFLMTYQEMACELGRSTNGVEQRCRKLGYNISNLNNQ